jgi:hypothetical protein
VVWPKGPGLCVYGGFADGGRPLDDLFLYDLRTLFAILLLLAMWSHLT